jgi:hypothetical protein
MEAKESKRLTADFELTTTRRCDGDGADCADDARRHDDEREN